MTLEVKEFEVQDRMGPLTLRGKLLADCRYESETKTRWTDMALYKVVDRSSRWQYVLEIIAQTYVYHRAGGPCARKKHRVLSVKELRDAVTDHRWRYLVPCPRPGCAPGDLEEMDATTKVAEERPDPHLYPCTKASDILDRIYRHSGTISELAADLLHRAAEEDPSIAMAWKNKRRL